MYERKIPKDLTCGTAMVIEIIGSKWKPCLLYHINKGFNRPSQMLRHVPNASRQVLNQQLKELQGHGIISKVIYKEMPPRVEYYLTDLGKTLLPILNAMDYWGNHYINNPDQLPESMPIKAILSSY